MLTGIVWMREEKFQNMIANLNLIIQSLYEDDKSNVAPLEIDTTITTNTVITLPARLPPTILHYLPHNLRRKLLREIISNPLIGYSDFPVLLKITYLIIAHDDVEMLQFYKHPFKIYMFYIEMIIKYRSEKCLRHMIEKMPYIWEKWEWYGYGHKADLVEMFFDKFFNHMLQSEWLEGMKILCNQKVLKKCPHFSRHIMMHPTIIQLIFSCELSYDIVEVYYRYIKWAITHMITTEDRTSVYDKIICNGLLLCAGKMPARCFHQALRLIKIMELFWNNEIEAKMSDLLFNSAALSAVKTGDIDMLNDVFDWGYSKKIYPKKHLFMDAIIGTEKRVNVEVVRRILQDMHFSEHKKLQSKTSIIKLVLNGDFNTEDIETLAVLLTEHGFHCVFFDMYCICMNRGMPTAMRAIMEKEKIICHTYSAIAESISDSSLAKLRDMIQPYHHLVTSVANNDPQFGQLSELSSHEGMRKSDCGDDTQCPYTRCAALLHSHYRLALSRHSLSI